MRDTLSLYRIGARPYLAPRSPCLRALRKSRTMEQIQAISRPASLPDGVEAYWTTPDEVRSSSFGDWFFSHTSYCLPLHHWEGHLTLTQEALVIRGKDKRTWAAVEYRVAPNELEEVYHGYDDVFTRWVTGRRQWLPPLCSTGSQPPVQARQVPSHVCTCEVDLRVRAHPYKGLAWWPSCASCPGELPCSCRCNTHVSHLLPCMVTIGGNRGKSAEQPLPGPLLMLQGGGEARMLSAVRAAVRVAAHL